MSSASDPSDRARSQPESQAPRQVAVPGIILDFLERATVAVAGTRDRQLVPRLHRISGWKVEADGRTMTCFVARGFTSGLAGALEDNGQLAVTIEEVGPHETYQFKGRYLSSRPLSDEDRALCREIKERFVKVVSTKFGLPEEACRAFSPGPELAVSFELGEIYLQTPGPGAGRRLVPPERG